MKEGQKLYQFGVTLTELEAARSRPQGRDSTRPSAANVQKPGAQPVRA